MKSSTAHGPRSSGYGCCPRGSGCTSCCPRLVPDGGLPPCMEATHSFALIIGHPSSFCEGAVRPAAPCGRRAGQGPLPRAGRPDRPACHPRRALPPPVYRRLRRLQFIADCRPAAHSPPARQACPLPRPRGLPSPAVDGPVRDRNPRPAGRGVRSLLPQRDLPGGARRSPATPPRTPARPQGEVSPLPLPPKTQDSRPSPRHPVPCQASRASGRHSASRGGTVWFEKVQG
jgi:hypothetical protein